MTDQVEYVWHYGPEGIVVRYKEDIEVVRIEQGRAVIVVTREHIDELVKQVCAAQSFVHSLPVAPASTASGEEK